MKKKKPSSRKNIDGVSLFFSGLFIGVANLIPGVSGGTIAVVLGVYDDLILSLSNIIPNPFKNSGSLKLLTVLSLGAASGIFFFSGLVNTLLTDYPFPTLFFFMGLVIGSIPVVYRTHEDMSPTFLRISLFCLFCFGLISLTWQTPIINQLPISTNAYLVISGILAAGSMIVPGVSGSFILLLLGTYQTILQAVSTGDITILGWVAIGAVLGLLLVSKGIASILRHYPSASHYAILGLLVGSTVLLFPSIQNESNIVKIQGALCFVSGYLLVHKLG